MTEIISTDTPELFRSAVQRAAELLRAGELAAIPTETVYGLAANALNGAAVEKIFRAKERPSFNPIIVHVASLEMAGLCASEWPTVADSLAASFWPGPLTLVLARSSLIPDVVTAGGPTVGLRWPSHPFTQALIRECGFPLAAPSANAAGRISPTNAEHVARSLGDRVKLVVDGGPAHVGIESTVLDVSVTPPRLFRPGIISASALLAVTGALAESPGDSDAHLRSPGQLLKHYAPTARLVTLEWENETDLVRQLIRFPQARSRIHIIAHHRIPIDLEVGRVSVIPNDAEAFARALYAELHQCDRTGAELIVVERPPSGGLWDAIQDRLRRASA
jgi:L-threonylcarbamoyladenylate synthase